MNAKMLIFCTNKIFVSFKLGIINYFDNLAHQFDKFDAGPLSLQGLHNQQGKHEIFQFFRGLHYCTKGKK